MRKKELNTLYKKILKEGNHLGLTFNPTLEECDYLNKKNIAITKSQVKRRLLSYFLQDEEKYYFLDSCDFVLDK